MYLLEKSMVESLKDLKKNYHAIGVKTEFETEGSSFQEAVKLKEIASRAGLDLTIKIGGCASVKDMFEVKMIGANSIVAPMVESRYAMEKFVKTAKQIFKNDIKLYINIETECGIDNLQEIFRSELISNISGIVLGRTDLCNSLNIKSVDDEIIYQHALAISNMCKLYNKEFTIGGTVCEQSVPFLKKISNINKFETRNIVFDKSILCQNAPKNGILKALDFEILWLKYKQKFYNSILSGNIERIKTLKIR